jgi:DNA-binding transcriptional MerR regulator
MNELLSTVDVACLLHCHPSTIRRAERRGELLPFARVGNRRIYDRRAVEEFAARRAQGRRTGR